MKSSGSRGTLSVWGQISQETGSDESTVKIGGKPIFAILGSFEDEPVHIVIAAAKEPITPINLPDIQLQCEGVVNSCPPSWEPDWSEVTPGGYSDGWAMVGEHNIARRLLEYGLGWFAVLVISTDPLDLTAIAESTG
jgi:hypothetical protein